MKLTNPTDEQLNEAFAKKVAGIKRTVSPTLGVIFSELIDGTRFQIKLPAFTQSADAVLPFLEKYVWERDENGSVWVRDPVFVFHGAGGHCDRVNGPAFGLAKAAVIAILRADENEVIFTP